MQFKQEFFNIIFLLHLWQSASASPHNSRKINHKQKKLIEGSMDLKANPCNDFYQYACGNWNEMYFEAGTKFFEPITMLDYNVNQEMSSIFNKFPRGQQPKFIMEVAKYYKSCRNLWRYESIHYLTWLKINDNFKWPALWDGSRKSVQFDWVQTLAKMRTYGLYDVFIQQIVMPRIKNAKEFIIDLDKPVADGGFKPLSKKNFKQLINSITTAITILDLKDLWQEIEEFEQELQLMDEIEDIEVSNEEEYEQQRLIYAKDLPFDWLKDYVKTILNQTELQPRMKLYIQNVPYMKALDKLLKQHSQRFICKYLEIRFLWYLLQSRPSDFGDEDCLASSRKLTPNAMFWLYEQQHPELWRENSTITELFDNIRKLFSATLTKNQHGFNETITAYLQTKINNMKLRLNNIPRTDSVATLEKFYQPLNLNSKNFYENHLKLLRFNYKRRLDLLNSNSTILEYSYLENSDTGSSSSPFFVQHANTVFIPLTMLQQPIYSPNMDDVYRYSSLGFLLAHEIFHGFDDSGEISDNHINIYEEIIFLLHKK